ncbi:hypothetical protein GCM10020000_53050 [Streptomyces olivoverticillatus]
MRHVREAVRFADAVQVLEEQGVTAFVELGPDAVLTAMAAESTDGVLVATTRRGHDEARTAVEALARLHVHGAEIDWQRYFGTPPRSRSTCPRTPSGVSATGSTLPPRAPRMPPRSASRPPGTRCSVRRWPWRAATGSS